MGPVPRVGQRAGLLAIGVIRKRITRAAPKQRTDQTWDRLPHYAEPDWRSEGGGDAQMSLQAPAIAASTAITAEITATIHN